MPVTAEQLAEQRRRVEAYGEKVAQYAGIGEEFTTRVREELRQRAAQRGAGELARMTGEARREFVAAPAQMREEAVGLDPLATERAIAERRGGLLAQIDQLQGIRREREATVADILGGVAAPLEAEGERAATMAGIAQQTYGNILQQANIEETQRWHDIQAGLERARLSISARTREGAAGKTIVTPWGEFQLTDPQALNWITKESEKAVKRADVLQEGRNKLANINRAIEILETKDPVGPMGVTARWIKTKTRMGLGADPELVEYQSLVDEIGAVKMFEIGGKVLPMQEKELLSSWVPLYNTPRQTALTNLGRMQKAIINQYGFESLTGTSPYVEAALEPGVGVEEGLPLGESEAGLTYEYEGY